MPNHRNLTIEATILANPGMPVKDLSKLSGIGISQVMKVKRRLKKALPEKFGLEDKTVNEDSLNELATQVLEGMTSTEKESFIRGIVKKLFHEKRLNYDDMEMMGF